MRFKLFDYIIIFLSISFAVAAGMYVYTGGEGPLRVRIRSEENVYVYPLDEDREVAVEGPIGTTYVHALVHANSNLPHRHARTGDRDIGTAVADRHRRASQPDARPNQPDCTARRAHRD